ncbi:MAG: ankyrin repeat domain-containing protein [Nitrospinota bacterium]|nr:ankyrin repeat domain-containing protein [Nitrospinota bacterium]
MILANFHSGIVSLFHAPLGKISCFILGMLPLAPDRLFGGLDYAFLVAVHNWELEEVRALIKLGASLEARTNPSINDGNTPLTVAVSEGHSLIVDELVTHGADVNVCRQDGATPF